jgi:hypothetical protein
MRDKSSRLDGKEQPTGRCSVGVARHSFVSAVSVRTCIVQGHYRSSLKLDRSYMLWLDVKGDWLMCWITSFVCCVDVGIGAKTLVSNDNLILKRGRRLVAFVSV